jgi:hypothetical protein
MAIKIVLPRPAAPVCRSKYITVGKEGESRPASPFRCPVSAIVRSH